MSTKTLYKYLLVIQGFYVLVTALWALVDIDSFMWVTGPKTDIWLVKTVAVVLVPIAMSLILPAFFTATFWQTLVPGSLSAIGLAAIDFYYALNDTISNIYLWDAVAECIFLGCWVYLSIKRLKSKTFSNEVDANA